MGFRAWIFRLIDRWVDGKVNNLKSNDGKRRYAIPPHATDICTSKQGRSEKEEYRDIDYLVKSAREAMAHGDSRAFYRIFSLMSDLKMTNKGIGGCFSSDGVRHLDYQYSRKELAKLVQSDKTSMRNIQNYAWIMEGIMPSPTGGFRVGTGTLFASVPYLGAVLIILMNSIVYIRVASQISAPRWLLCEIFWPLLWAALGSFQIPGGGAAMAGRISPSRRAAKKVKEYLKLRAILSMDTRDPDDDLWKSKSLNSIIPGLSDQTTKYTWKYSEEFRKELFGQDLRFLYQSEIRNRVRKGIEDVV